MAKKKSKGINSTQADIWFSKCVRMRVNWTCEKCGINLEHFKAGLDCSHFISRKYQSVRYHPKNAFAHCKGCHQTLGGGRWGGGNVAEFAHHYDSVFSEKGREIVRLLSKWVFNGYKNHIKEMSKHFKGEFDRMHDMRMSGVTERIEFKPYLGAEELIIEENRIKELVES